MGARIPIRSACPRPSSARATARSYCPAQHSRAARWPSVMGSAESSPSSTAQVRIDSSHARESSKRSTAFRYMPSPRPALSETGTGSARACSAAARSSVSTSSPLPIRNRWLATFVSALASSPSGGDCMAPAGVPPPRRAAGRLPPRRGSSPRTSRGHEPAAASRRLPRGALVRTSEPRSRPRSPTTRSPPGGAVPGTRFGPGSTSSRAAPTRVRATAESPSK